MAQEPKWTGRGKGTPLGYLFFILMVRYVGLMPAYAFLGLVVLRYVFGDPKPRTAIRRLRDRLGLRTGLADIYRHFYTFGMSLVDRFAFLQVDTPPFAYTCINEDLIVKAADEGRGVILLSAHVGNWEVAGNLLNDRIGRPINVVMLEAEKESLQRVTRRVTDQRRITIIPLTPGSPDTVLRIVHALRRGEIVAMLGDRVMDAKAERVDFLGAPALFPTGPFALAAATGAPVIPIATVKTGLRHYTFRAWDPIRLDNVPREGRDQAITTALRHYVAILEQITRAHPHQWYNFYEFWE